MVIITRKTPLRPPICRMNGRKTREPKTLIRTQEKELRFSPSLHLASQSVTKDSVLRSICKESYFQFVKTHWNTVVPETPIWNWHIERQCHPASTIIETPQGQKTIGELVESQYEGKVLVYDFVSAQSRWAHVRDWVKQPGRVCYRLRTSDEELTATYDHPIYVKGRGYVACCEIQVGDVVLRAMRKPILRVCREDSTHSQVLQSSMFRQVQTTCMEQMSILRKEDQKPQNQILSWMPDVTANQTQQKESQMCRLWEKNLSSSESNQTSQETTLRCVLFSTMFWSICDRIEQPRLPRWTQCDSTISLHSEVLENPSKSVAKGLSDVFSVRSNEDRQQRQTTRLSSHRLESTQQQDLEYGYALSEVSQSTKRGWDTSGDYEVVESVVLSIVQEARIPEAVYCLTVDHPDHNYFADGILVHNCNEIQQRLERIFANKPKEDDLLYNQPPGTSKPVWENCDVLMGDGTYRKLRRVKVGDFVIGKSGKPRLVKAVHKQGELPSVVIKTFNGRVVTAALDHPILTADGWIEAGNIVVGQHLAVMNKARPHYTITERTTDQFALAGYMVGDGCVVHGNCSFANCDPVYLKDFYRICRRLGFGCRTDYLTNAKTGVTTSQVHLRTKKPKGYSGLKQHRGSGRGKFERVWGPRKWVRDIGLYGLSSKTKKVPEFVHSGTNEQIARFIATYFHCDGTVFRSEAGNSISVSMTSVSKKLLVGIQRLLLRLGINLRLVKRKAKFGFCYNRGLTGYVAYTLMTCDKDEVAKFAAAIPLKSYKRDLLSQHGARTRFDGDYAVDRVVSVKRVAPLPCRCLTVEKDESFIANDIVVHNSTTFSIMLVPWAWTRMPSFRAIHACHTFQPLAMNLSRLSRQVIQSDLYRKLFPEVQLSKDQAAKANFANTKGGQRFAVGNSGRILGVHAHCFPAGTVVTTDCGDRDIAEIVNEQLDVKVLAFSTQKPGLSWQPIRAWMKTENQSISRVVFSDGSSLEGTDNHPVFVLGKGWVDLSELQPNDEVIHADSSLQSMQNRFSPLSVGIEESTKSQLQTGLLRNEVLWGMDQSKSHRKQTPSLFVQKAEMSNLRQNNVGGKPQTKYSKVLLQRMQGDRTTWQKPSTVQSSQNVLSMVCERHYGARIPNRKSNSVLSTLCQCSSQCENDFSRESSLYQWEVQNVLLERFFTEKKSCQKPRVSQMLLLRKEREESQTGNPSCRLQQNEQQDGQSCSGLSLLPRDDARNSQAESQVGTKTVQAVIKKVRTGVTVYNLEVAQDHTYFANGILVHNCIGMDDIISPDETISDLELERVHNWITGELLTRKVSSTISVVMQTMQRLHQDDPSARMSLRPRVTHFILPATNEFPIKPENLIEFYKPDPEQPNNGKLYLDPIRLPQKVLDEKYAELLDYGYAGQFGQDPVPLGGGKFKIDKIQKYSSLMTNEVSMTTRAWDKAISQKKKSAYTAGVKLGRTKDGKILLLNVQRGRWDSASRERHIRQTAEQDTRRTIVGIEQEPGSGGQESAQRSVTHTLRGFRVVVMKPTADKEVRADPLSQQVNFGNFYVPEWMYDRNGQPIGWLKDFLDEMRHFPHSKYKDQIDAAASAFLVLCKKRHRIGGLKPSVKYRDEAPATMDY